jgi:DNA-binding MarR family transcriptional regulator
MATETKRRSRSDPATEAWDLITEVFAANRGRFVAVLGEFDLWPPQWFALQALDEPTPMGKLAGMLHCDSSNVTGITDRLEQRGLVERRPAADDRRVKLLVLTPEGRRVREQIQRRLSVPPEAITSLSRADQRALRDLLRLAVSG